MMNPRVRDLYKRIIYVGREYPLGLNWVRDKAKTWFRQNAELTDEVEIRRAVAKGRFMVREMQAVIQLKKYRTLKKRYSQEETSLLDRMRKLEQELGKNSTQAD